MDKLISPWLVVVLVTLIITFHDACAFPEKGKWTHEINQETQFTGVFKSLFSNSTISFNIFNCKSEKAIQLKVSWSLMRSPCWQEFVGLENMETENGNILRYLDSPNYEKNKGLEFTNDLEYIRSEEMIFLCNDSVNPIIMPEISSPMKKIRLGRSGVTGSPQFVVPKEGVYLLIIRIQTNPIINEIKNISFTAQTAIEMKSDSGFLSVVDWPLLPFYGAMCALYSLLGALWLIICFCRCRDIHRIQMWIGCTLFLGMIEKAVYLAEYDSVNKTGELTLAAEYSAEILSCAKRSLARILIMVASIDYDITKPRLGATLRKIVGAGIFYMGFSSIESYLKLVQPKNIGSLNIYAASVMLALIDTVICLWIFSSLFATIRANTLRRNTEKIFLYKPFTGMLIFAVVASLLYMLWSIYFHQMDICLADWKELWLDDAFWKLLFSILLMVMMVLWRPRNNNQRYAFTSLLDSEDEESNETSIDDKSLMW